MRPPTRFWHQEVPHIEKFLLQGLPVAAVARYYGVTPQHINRVLRTFDSPMQYKRRMISHPLAIPPKKAGKAGKADKAALKAQLEANRVKAAQKVLYLEARSMAQVRGISWEISEKDVEWPHVCPVRGVPLAYRVEGYTHNHKHTRPVLALIDPRRGYVPGNVRVISAMAARDKKTQIHALSSMI